jgi:hypothetical protein
MSREPRVVVVVIDGLPVDLLDACWGELDFLRMRTPHRAKAVSCFPSTTGPAYFPLVAGTTPGRADITGIRWFDRTTPTRSRFPHRGLRSYVGPDAAKMKTDTRARTFFDEDAWPASTPVDKDSPKKREKSRDLVWALAHFTHRWEQADRRTAWKLGRALAKGRPIVFAVFPSVDEFGHTLGFTGGRPRQALLEIDRMLGEKLAGFNGDVLVTADHGLTATDDHLDLRRIVEELVGPTVAFPLIGMPNPAAVVCESGNAMANVYLRGEDWSKRPSADDTLALARQLIALPGIDSVAVRGEENGVAELYTGTGLGRCGFHDGALFQEGDAFPREVFAASPSRYLEETIDDPHPDAAFALSSLFASERAGDLLVSAAEGVDLRTSREWPEHHASHGALHRAHTIVPVLSSASLPAHPLRTLDVFAETLRLAGIELARYPGSDAELLARGAWSPGVWR